MAFDTTILIKKVEGLKEAFENGQFGDALIAALNTGNGLLQQRVFTKNQDILGNSFGTYKKGAVKDAIIKTDKKGNLTDLIGFKYELSSYQIKRKKHGRQTDPKDLELFGGLRRAIQTQLENDKSAVIQFNNDKAAKVAQGQANQISNIRNGKKGTTKNYGSSIKIFGLNESERNEVVEQGAELIKQVLRK